MSLAKSSVWHLKRVLRKVYPLQVPQPHWDFLLGQDAERWRRTLAALPQNAPNVLIAPNVSHPSITTFDSLLGVALTLRGARVQYLMCGQSLPACQPTTVQHLPSSQELLKHGPTRALCGACFDAGAKLFTSLGFPVNRLSEFVLPAEFRQAEERAASVPYADIPTFQEDGVLLGEHAVSGAVRFFASGAIEDEPDGEQVLRRYLRAALVAFYAGRRLFGERDFRAASLHHGIYVPQGVLSAAARARGVRVANWALGYRKATVIYSHDDTYHKTMLTEPTGNWEDMHWSEDTEEKLVAYLKDRWSGAQDWVSYSPTGNSTQELIAKQVGIDLSRPCIGLLTNVLWDAQLFYSCSVFENMMDWLKVTIRYFEARPELQLLIRVHPAEVRGGVRSRQTFMDALERAFPKLPPNVFVIRPESPISTYAAMMACDSVLIYGTKTGIELACFGIPVVVAGEAWVRDKGITTDIRSREHYQDVLRSLPFGRRLPPEQVKRARKYAYHYFFRRMIPLGVLKPEPPGSWSPYGLNVSTLDDLLPDRDQGLDVICAGILEGRNFIYPAEVADKG